MTRTVTADQQSPHLFTRQAFAVKRKKNPTWRNALRHSTTSAYSLTGPRCGEYPLISHPRNSQNYQHLSNSPGRQ